MITHDFLNRPYTLKDWNFLFPCGGAIWDCFQKRIHPITKLESYHQGVDIGSFPFRGSPIKAVGNGTVTVAESPYEGTGYGNCIVIMHGKNNEYFVTSLYAHLDEVKVKIGQKVKRGQVIGLMGSTGMSTAPHLHFEFRLNNTPVEPLSFFARRV